MLQILRKDIREADRKNKTLKFLRKKAQERKDLRLLHDGEVEELGKKEALLHAVTLNGPDFQKRKPPPRSAV